MRGNAAQATHVDLATKLYGSPEVKASPRFSVPKRVPNGFTIEHYAGAVTYHTEHFLDKNRDFVVAEHQGLMQGSASGFVRALFPPDEDSSSGTVGVIVLTHCSIYRFQLR